MTEQEHEAQFTRFYKRFYPRVLGYALRRIQPDLAHDVADETFLVAWRRWDEVPGNALPWLLVTARNVISDLVRRNQRQDAIAIALSQLAESIGETGADVIAVERITVLGALARLPEQDRDALMLTVWDGLDHSEAATVCGCSRATFAVRLHRARRRLTAVLEELDAGLRPMEHMEHPERAERPLGTRQFAPPAAHRPTIDSV